MGRELTAHSFKRKGRTEQEQIDLLSEEAIKKAADVFQEMMKPVLKMVDAADDLETLRNALKEERTLKGLYGEMESLELEDLLHQVMYLSELVGRSLE